MAGTNGAKEKEAQQEVLFSEQSILDRIIEEASTVRQGSLIPTKHEWSVYEAMAAMSAGTPFYGKLGGKAGIMAIMLYAREIKMPPMIALNGGIDFVMGRLQITARTANERIRESGHLVKIMSLDHNSCSIYGKRKDTGEEHTATFTVEDAKRAQLVKKDSNWEKHPGDMCFARAITRLARRLFPDVIGGAHIEGEPSEFEQPEQDQPDKPSEPKPATIAGMMQKNKPSQEKPAEKSSEPEPTKAEQSKPEPPKEHEAPKEPEPPKMEQPQEQQPEPPKTEPPRGNGNDEEQRKAKGRAMIIDKLSKFYGGDVDKINASLEASLPNDEVKPNMDNLDQFSLSHLQEINRYVIKLTSGK